MKIWERTTRRNIALAAAGITGAGVVAYLALPNNAPDPGRAGTARPVQVRVPQLEMAPQLALSGLSWEDYQGVLLPRSATDGPRTIRDGLAEGFAQTPTGALLAATHIVVRANAQWGPAVFEPTINSHIVGPDTDALLKTTRDSYEDQRNRARLPAGAALGRAYVVLEGFRWQGYTPQLASLDLVSAGPGDSDATVRAATRIQLQWRNGDWRVVAPPGGSWGGAAVPISSLDGDTRFQQGGR